MTQFVPSGVIEKAALHDMIYAACPQCFTSMTLQMGSRKRPDFELLQVRCSSCGRMSRRDELQFKYRLKLQLQYGSTIADAIMFDEATEALLGVPAWRMKRELLWKYPALPQVLEQLVVGLRVSFSFQQPPPKRNAKQGHFTRDLKIIQIEPLIPQLLPKPAAILALKLLQQRC
ncbi:unnamed protein product [Hyaloperonospora brassicae]|uniref:Replication factor A C-terminal domain-containing protein n=1 Tax=Hyaloperonospora brassicae TaxID=162125 RepID=A0AAV0TNL9_HYABA|nr:unnamed protein product [Hyaloperonospora brassicae]